MNREGGLCPNRISYGGSPVEACLEMHNEERKMKEKKQNGNFHIWLFNLEKISGIIRTASARGVSEIYLLAKEQK